MVMIVVSWMLLVIMVVVMVNRDDMSGGDGDDSGCLGESHCRDDGGYDFGVIVDGVVGLT